MIKHLHFRNPASGIALGSVLLFGAPVLATSSSPLLTDSESSYASACLDYGDTAERIVEICRIALADAQGASARQLSGMRRSLGDALREVGDHEAARAQFDAILADNPTDVSGLLGMGWLLLEDDNLAEQARIYFEKALNINVSAEAVAGLATAEYVLQQVSLDDYLQRMDAALAIQPNYPWVIREKGWRLYYADRGMEAVEMFSEALELNPTDANALAGRAQALTDFDPQRALVDINRGLQEDPDDPWWYYQRSIVHHALQNHRRAQADAERYIEREPQIADGYVQKARAMAALGRRGDALKLLAEIRDRDGIEGLDFLRYWHALMLTDEGQWQSARDALQPNFDLNEADRYDYRIMAHILIELEKPTEAIKMADAGLAISPDWPLLHFYRAWALIKQRKPEKALDEFEVVREMGLRDWMAEEITSALVQEGYYVQAIQLRVALRGE